MFFTQFVNNTLDAWNNLLQLENSLSEDIRPQKDQKIMKQFSGTATIHGTQIKICIEALARACIILPRRRILLSCESDLVDIKTTSGTQKYENFKPQGQLYLVLRDILISNGPTQYLTTGNVLLTIVPQNCIQNLHAPFTVALQFCFQNQDLLYYYLGLVSQVLKNI